MDRKTEKSEALQYEPSKVTWATASFVRTPPPILARITLYLSLVVIAFLVVFSMYYPIADSIDTDGTIQFETPPISVNMPKPGKITAIRARPLQYVQRGEVLFETDQGPVTSPTAGWISSLNVGQPTAIAAGASLAQILPEPYVLSAQVTIPRSVSSRVLPGMRARVWLDEKSRGKTTADLEGIVEGVPFTPVSSDGSNPDPKVHLRMNPRESSSSAPLPTDGAKIRASIVIGQKLLAKVIVQQLFGDQAGN